MKDIIWLIKVHPEEAHSPTVVGVKKLIEENFEVLPDHIRIIPAETQINPFGLYSILDGAITLFGTAGLEMALLGKRAIVAGQSHYEGKGFTLDARNKETYFNLLAQIPTLPPMSEFEKKLAKQYAYSYFIQRQIPLKMMLPEKTGWGRFDFSKIENLLPGSDPFIDFICDRILDGKDFVLEDELVRLNFS